MSHLPAESRVRVTLPQLHAWHHAGRKLVMTTAYDAVTARIADAAGVDVILVGDSVGNVCLGFENTLPVSMAMMNHHLEAVARTHPTLRNPGSQNYDLSVSKRVAVDPEHAVEFSAAGFNFLNHANWNDPDSGIGPASAPNVNAGKIIGSRGGRVIQLGLRFSF